MDEPILPDAARVNGTAAVGTAEGPESSEHNDRTENLGATGNGALRPSFLARLAAAMREAAIRERERIAGVVAEDAASHIEKVRSRAAIETEELRRLAQEDLGHIEQWSATEIARIQAEAEQKVEDRRSSLDDYIKQHDAIIETEIEGVNGALRDYESTLDRFFAELSAESDPSAIVRRAGQLPPPPDLDEIRATARTNAMTRLAETESGADEATEAVAAVTPPETVNEATTDAVEAHIDSTEKVEAAESTVAMSSADSPSQGEGDDGAMSGVMVDGLGSVDSAAPAAPAAPAESVESTAVPEVAVTQEAAPAPVAASSETAEAPAEVPTEAPAVPEPVGVMEPGAQRVPSWPAPAPTPSAESAQLAPTIDHTSAAVRLLRSVAPWTAPTHAGSQGPSDSE